VRVAVVDIGSNSTRLLIADVDARTRSVQELVRRSQVTRLGEGVDSSGRLGRQSVKRVLGTLDDYRGEIDEQGASANLAVLTQAVREAANGAEFTERVRDRYDLDARVLSGEEEAALTFLGAMSGRDADQQPTVVIDIGGGSTEFIGGRGAQIDFCVSLPAGVVRMSERHIHSDPPEPRQLQALALDAATVFEHGLPAERRNQIDRGVAVAGTATSAAAIELELDPYDPDRVHGHRLTLATVELLLARLADMNEAKRRNVVGLHPDRAPTIVAGMVLLSEALRAFQLDVVEVSEHDILHGGALRLAGVA
jgi:exopolyphosphatase / guanosine-5'-triphosphate,3'-diphosphate pyrophosphatase